MFYIHVHLYYYSIMLFCTQVVVLLHYLYVILYTLSYITTLFICYFIHSQLYYHIISMLFSMQLVILLHHGKRTAIIGVLSNKIYK